MSQAGTQNHWSLLKTLARVLEAEHINGHIALKANKLHFPLSDHTVQMEENSRNENIFIDLDMEAKILLLGQVRVMYVVSSGTLQL